MVKRWSTSSTIIVAALAAVLVLVVVIGVVRMNRQPAVAAAFTTLAETQHVHVLAELNLNLPFRLQGRERPFTAVGVRIDGDVVRSDEGQPELGGTLYAEARGRGNIFFTDGDVRILQDGTRFRLDNLPVLLNPSGSLVDRWTSVDRALMATNPEAPVREVLAEIVSRLEPAGVEDKDGASLARYTLPVSGDDLAELEEQVARAFDQEASGNQALHVLTRLLDAHNVKSLDVWVDRDESVVRIVELAFVRPLQDGSAFDFADLKLTFSEYGVMKTVDRPEVELTVKPEIFARLFGTGEVGAVSE